MKEFIVSGYADELACQVTVEASSKEEAIYIAETEYDMIVIGCDEQF